MKHKTKKTAPISVEELTDLIVSIMEARDRKKVQDAEKEAIEEGMKDIEQGRVYQHEYHPTPHCPGCRCYAEKNPNLVCTCGGWWGIGPPPPCPRHGQAYPITATCSSASQPTG